MALRVELAVIVCDPLCVHDGEPVPVRVLERVPVGVTLCVCVCERVSVTLAEKDWDGDPEPDPEPDCDADADVLAVADRLGDCVWLGVSVLVGVRDWLRVRVPVIERVCVWVSDAVLL